MFVQYFDWRLRICMSFSGFVSAEYWVAEGVGGLEVSFVCLSTIENVSGKKKWNRTTEYNFIVHASRQQSSLIWWVAQFKYYVISHVFGWNGQQHREARTKNKPTSIQCMHNMDREENFRSPIFLDRIGQSIHMQISQHTHKLWDRNIWIEF